MTFIFRNRTIFWDISKWNRGQINWDRKSTIFWESNLSRFIYKMHKTNSDLVSFKYDNLIFQLLRNEYIEMYKMK